MAHFRPSSKEDKTKYQELYETKGLPGVLEILQKKLQEWKSTPIKIAVTGSSGTGKSYFINAIRNVKPGSEKAAKTGRTETTKDIYNYSFPRHSLIHLYDLPGCGTTSFPRKTYVKDVKFETYDFFIIMSSLRFTEDDLWLANEVEKKKKRFYFCRSKIDNDVTAAEDDYPGKSIDEVLKIIRKDCSDKLKMFPTAKIYLISNRDSSSYDFPSLSNQIIHDLNEVQAEALAFSMSTLTEGSIEIKKEVLEKRIDSVAVMVALKGAFTFRLTDVNAIKEEILYYLQQLELDSDSLKTICSTFPIDLPSLISNLRSTSMNFSDKGIQSTIDEVAPVSLPAEIVRFVPIVGIVFNGVKSNQMAKVVLKQYLDWFTDDANTVKKRMIKEMTKVKI